MQYISFIAADTNTGISLPNPQAFVYVAGTTTLTPLFDASGNSISNPARGTTTGLIGFATGNGVYDIQIADADGNLKGPIWKSVQIYDGVDLSNLLTAIINGGFPAGTMVYNTYALMNADKAHAQGTWAVVIADPDDTLNGVYIKLGASGSGSWKGVAYGSNLLQPLVDQAAGYAAEAAASAQALQNAGGQFKPYFTDLVNVLPTTVGNDKYFASYLDPSNGVEHSPTTLRLDLLEAWALPMPYFSDRFTGELVATPDGQVLQGQYVDGPRVDGVAITEYGVDVVGTSPNRTIWISAPGIPSFQISNATDSLGDNKGAYISGGYVLWTNSLTGLRKEPLYVSAPSMIDGGIQHVRLILGFGQSTTVGINSGSALTTSPVKPGYVLKFDNVRVLTNGHDPSRLLEPVQDRYLRSLSDSYENDAAGSGETQWTQAAYECQKILGNTYAVCAATIGIGSQDYAHLKKGTPPYANAMAVIKRAWLIAKLRGKTFDVIVWYPESEGDQFAADGTWTADLNELQNDLTTDINAMINRSGPVVLGVDGYSSFCAYGTTRSTQPFESLQWVLDNPTKGAYATGTFIRDSASDGVHGTSAGNALHGAEIGNTCGLVFSGDSNQLPFYINGPASVSGGAAIFPLHLPKNAGTPSLVSSVVSALSNYGITIHRQDNDNPITVASVSLLSGPPRLSVTPSSPPVGVPLYFEFGWRGQEVAGPPYTHSGPITGNRTPINAGCPQTSYYGVSMAKLLAPWRQLVTF